MYTRRMYLSSLRPRHGAQYHGIGSYTRSEHDLFVSRDVVTYLDVCNPALARKTNGYKRSCLNFQRDVIFTGGLRRFAASRDAAGAKREHKRG